MRRCLKNKAPKRQEEANLLYYERKVGDGLSQLTRSSQVILLHLYHSSGTGQRKRRSTGTRRWRGWPGRRRLARWAHWWSRQGRALIVHTSLHCIDLINKLDLHYSPVQLVKRCLHKWTGLLFREVYGVEIMTAGTCSCLLFTRNVAARSEMHFASQVLHEPTHIGHRNLL